MRLLPLLIATLVIASQAPHGASPAPHGSVPRSHPAAYPAYAAGVGARLLTPEQVKKAFSSDLSKYVVVEVAIYPVSGKAEQVSWNDFTLRLTGTDTAAKPSSPKLLASTIQKPKPGSREVSVYPHATVGYETGGPRYDPATGQTRGSGVYVGAGAGVGVGDASPGPSDRDRDVMELELSEKGLPEGTASAPVAGYLYFNLAKKKNQTVELEWRGVVLKLR